MSKPKKVLLVDDSKAMRLIVRRTLRQAGFASIEVIEASNGVEALAAIDQNSPDVVLSDWNMPEMNGFELLQNVRAKGLKTRFGFITTERTQAIREAAADAGAAFLIAKPFTADEFAAALRPFLG